MAESVFKYRLQLNTRMRQQLDMPAGAVILCAHEQTGTLMFWARVNPAKKTETRTFQVVATGQPFDSNLTYVGTCFLKDDTVWHILEDV